MDELKMIWWARLHGFWQEAGKYLRIIITGYAYLPMIFLLLLGSGYKFLLQWLPADFPSHWVLAFIIAALLSRGSVRTFLKMADIVFLLPLEPKLPKYFLRSFVYSFVLQSLGLSVIVFLMGPLYSARISPERSDFYVLLLAVIILKAWNLLVVWLGQKEPSDRWRKALDILRFAQNLMWSLVLFHAPLANPWLASVITIVITWLAARALEKGYPWLRLIEQEQKNRSSFYSFAQWFMEIPQLSRKVGERSFLLSLAKQVPHKPEWAYVYRFIRSFTRYNDLFYGYIRLVVISFLLLLYIRYVYLSAFLLLVFLLLNMLHLSSGWNRVKQHFWLELYPLPRSYSRHSFVVTIKILLCIHLMILILALCFPYPVWSAAIFGVVGIGMVMILTGLLLPKMIKERE